MSDRKFYINLQGLDLNSPDGQNSLLIQCEIALASQPLTAIDQKIINTLLSVIKVKKDVDSLRIAASFWERLASLEERLKQKGLV